MSIFKKIRLRKTGFLALLVIAAFIPMGAGDSYFEISKNLEIYNSLFKELNISYVDEIDPSTTMRVGIDAMLASLDPYTNYISEADLEGYRTQTTGKYGGIGAIIRKMDDYIGIVEPFEGAPADKVGLQAGDLIIAVEGESVKNRSVSDVSAILKGQAGTEVELTIRKALTNETVTKVLIREEVGMETVPFYGMVNDKVGYIRLEQFTNGCGREVENALKSLKEDHGMESVILDLRGNPGGLLHEAVNICNLFIEKNKLVVSTKGKVKEWDQNFKTLGQPIDLKMPVVVLTSGSSASASEIVAGTLQDYDRGVILGDRTFGKGLVQQTRDLAYKTKLKVTVAKYYVPSGRCIQAINYSEREEDGSPHHIADSLRNEFKTHAGRTVLDGGGIEPDVKVEKEEFPKILASLLTKELIFDFATQYRNDHPQIAPAKEFTLSEGEWNQFLDFIADKDYAYQTKSENLILQLEEDSKKEGYYDSIQDELADIQNEVKHDKADDVITHKSLIREALETEIAGRYYYRSGKIQASFDDDVDIQAALKVLGDPVAYTGLLKP